MTRLLWDQVGSRRFEAGCDRGVLYLPDGTGVVWNGLTSVDEDFSDVAIQEVYLDGIKYLNRRTDGDYAGTLKALTYPDEFLQFDGVQTFDEGLFAKHQPVSGRFGLSYRTRIGNDTNPDLGYKLHVLYNLTASPDARSFGTLTDKSVGEEFSWKLTGVPVPVAGFKPTVHVVINSTKVHSGAMEIFENYLYGTDTSPGLLPDTATLVQMHQDVIMNPISEPL